MTSDRPKLVIIVGPTGAGKSTLAIALAQRVGAEIVSADSQQVYRGMDIGTGKVTAEQRAHVHHHLLDVARPDQEMTAARFVELADAAIGDISARGKPVVVVGGTGLYVRALLLGLFPGPPADEQLRAELAQVAQQELRARLEQVDPAAAVSIEPNDRTRTTRALEVFQLTGEPLSVHWQRHDHRRVPPRYPAKIIGLGPHRDQLYPRINARVEHMIADGFVAEVQELRAAGYGPGLRSQLAIGYAELHRYLDGTVDLPEAIRLTQRNSRRYARRQRSWYRADESVTWYAAEPDVPLDGVARFLVEGGLTSV